MCAKWVCPLVWPPSSIHQFPQLAMASSFSSSRIVYASHGDEIAAILVKLQGRRGSSIVLVANNCPELHSSENLAFLQRQAVDLELDLTLVCGIRAVRTTASSLGINVVSSLAALHPSEHSQVSAEELDSAAAARTHAGQDHSRVAGTPKKPVVKGTSRGSRLDRGEESPPPLATLSTRDTGRKSLPKRPRTSLSIDQSLSKVLALATLIVVVLFLVWGGVYLVVPSARIQLTPVQQQYSTELQLMADPEVRGLNAAAGKIPAQVVVIEETDELTVAATGTRDEPIGKAEGSVVFRNQISQPVVVPRGTVVLSNDNRRYLTSAQVTVPPTSATNSSFGQRRVAVVAEEVGPIGNVEAGTITHVEDQSLNQRLIVENDSPIQGGGLRATRFVTEEDRLKLFENLRQELLHQVMGRLRDRIDVSDDIFVQWDTDVIVEQAEYDKEVGQEGDEVTLRMKVKLRGTVYSSTYLAEVAPLIIERIVENQLGSYTLLRDTLTLGTPEYNGISEGVVLLTLKAQGDLVSTWDLGEVRRRLANTTREEAEAYLNTLMGVGEFVVEMGPDWYDRMPRLWFRISIEVTEPLKLAA